MHSRWVGPERDLLDQQPRHPVDPDAGYRFPELVVACVRRADESLELVQVQAVHSLLLHEALVLGCVASSPHSLGSKLSRRASGMISNWRCWLIGFA